MTSSLPLQRRPATLKRGARRTMLNQVPAQFANHTGDGGAPPVAVRSLAAQELVRCFSYPNTTTLTNSSPQPNSPMDTAGDQSSACRSSSTSSNIHSLAQNSPMPLSSSLPHQNADTCANILMPSSPRCCFFLTVQAWGVHFNVVYQHEARAFRSKWKGFIVAVLRFAVARNMTGEDKQERRGCPLCLYSTVARAAFAAVDPR